MDTDFITEFLNTSPSPPPTGFVRFGVRISKWVGKLLGFLCKITLNEMK